MLSDVVLAAMAASVLGFLRTCSSPELSSLGGWWSPFIERTGFLDEMSGKKKEERGRVKYGHGVLGSL